MADREDLLEMAKLSQVAERFDDMAEFMIKVAHTEVPFSAEDKDLYYEAFDKILGARISALRKIGSLEDDEETKSSPQIQRVIQEFKEKVVQETKEICNTALKTLNCLPDTTNEDEWVFDFKLKGDFTKYLYEATKDEGDAHTSLDYYEYATRLAALALPSTDLLRLKLALNLSVFYYEVKNSPYEAYQVAKKALIDAKAEVDDAQMDISVTSIMRLLADNMSKWRSNFS